MPILTATGAVADHICANCGAETHITPNLWVISDDADESIFSTPPCAGCGSTESFSWHDWVYQTPSARPRGLQPEEPFDTSAQPDHTHHGAEQMVLIERIAQAKGRKQKKHPDKSTEPYKEPPKAPKHENVRALVARMRGQA